MKVVTALKPLCKDCYIVRRGKRLYMRCKSQPRHKRRQGGFATLTNPFDLPEHEAQDGLAW